MKKVLVSALAALAMVVGGVAPAAHAAIPGFTATSGPNAGEITVTWNSVAGETYKLWHCRGANEQSPCTMPAQPIDPVTTPYVLTGLTPGYYFFTLRSYGSINGVGDINTGVEAGVAVGIPSAISATAGFTSGDLSASWTTAANATGYKIYYSTTDLPLNDAGWLSAGTSSYGSKTITGLSPSSTYYLKVVPTRAGSDYAGAKSSTSYAPSAGLAGPTGLTVTSPTSGRLNISWNAVSGSQGYNIYTGSSSTGPWISAANTYANMYTLSGLNTSTPLWVKVTSRDNQMNDAGDTISAASVTPNGGVGAGPTPGAIGTFTAVHTNVSGQIRLTWTAASNATDYDIQRSTNANSGFSSVGILAGLTRTYVQIDPTIAYYYKIVPYNGSTMGSATAVVGPVYADGLGSAVGQTVTTTVLPVVPVFKQPKFAMPSKIDVDTTGKVSLSGKDMGVSTVLIGGKEQKIDTNSDEKLVFDTTGLAKGVHDLVMKGAFGTYTVQKAIQVGEAVVTKVAAVSARQVGMAGGELSISGQGLEGTTQITMNGQVLEIVSKTDSKVTFKVPASTVASVNSIMIEGSFVPVIFKNAFSYTK